MAEVDGDNGLFDSVFKFIKNGGVSIMDALVEDYHDRPVHDLAVRIKAPA